MEKTQMNTLQSCDTFAVFKTYSETKENLFAKNSDRSPNEPQVLEYHCGKTGLTGSLQCTYISIPQAEYTYSLYGTRTN